MHSSNHLYYHNDQELHGFVAYQNTTTQARPGVLVVHDWSGRNDFACDKALLLAEMGYVGFAVDMYGHGCLGESIAEKKALMEPLMQDRAFLVTRMKQAYDALVQIPEVDPHRVAAIGFCFGGLCVLDLARRGAELRGVVSFHGLLSKPKEKNETIVAKVLVLHGYDDPMVSPEQVNDFCQEMTAAQVDWQVHLYGNTKHAFSNPKAADNQLGTVYNACAEKRSIQAMQNFLVEVFR